MLETMNSRALLSFIVGASPTVAAGIAGALLLSALGDSVESFGRANFVALLVVLFLAGMAVAMRLLRSQIAIDVTMFGILVGGCVDAFGVWLLSGLLHT